jgi:hypothetical protein
MAIARLSWFSADANAHPDAPNWSQRGIIIRSTLFRTLRITTEKENSLVLHDIRLAVGRSVANSTMHNAFAMYTSRKLDQATQVGDCAGKGWRRAL